MLPGPLPVPVPVPVPGALAGRSAGRLAGRPLPPAAELYKQQAHCHKQSGMAAEPDRCCWCWCW